MIKGAIEADLVLLNGEIVTVDVNDSIVEAIVRKNMRGQQVSPEESIDVMDAIRVYTWNGAYIGKG